VLRFKRICPNATVVAFEANLASCARIRQNAAVRRAGVVVEHVAASNNAGRVAFNAMKDRPQQSSLLERLHDDAVTTTTMDAVRLDDYLAATAGDVALWVDVEGAADQVLDGATGLRDRIVAIHVEVEGRGYIWSEQPNAAAVLERLLEWGFEPIGSAPVQAKRVQHD
jgi:FkbM family methyltransferase